MDKSQPNKTTAKRSRYFSLYCFDETSQRYLLLMIANGEGMANWLIANLPHEHIYWMNGKGLPSYHKYVHPEITQAK